MSSLNTSELLNRLIAKAAEKGKVLRIEDAPPCVIETPKKSVFAYRNEYVEWLTKRGYVKLGSGAYSTVLFHPSKPDRAIKVCNNDDWYVYAKFIASLKKNTIGVKVYSIKHHGSFYVASMERIERTASDTYDRPPAAEVVRELKYSAPKLLAEVTADRAAHNGKMRYLLRKDRQIVVFMRLLHKHDLVGDLHDGNWGYRADGSVCIFDPVTHVSHRKLSKYRTTDRFKIAA